MTRTAGSAAHGPPGLSTPELVGEVVNKMKTLAQQEIALALVEIRRNLQSEITMAKGLGLAGACVLVSVTLLLVSFVLALSNWVAPWFAALLASAVVMVIGAVVGLVGWTRRVKAPLAVTRQTLKEDAQWARQKLG